MRAAVTPCMTSPTSLEPCAKVLAQAANTCRQAARVKELRQAVASTLWQAAWKVARQTHEAASTTTSSPSFNHTALHPPRVRGLSGVQGFSPHHHKHHPHLQVLEAGLRLGVKHLSVRVDLSHPLISLNCLPVIGNPWRWG